MSEITTKPLCHFYVGIYKRMRRWFGFTTPYWLCEMRQDELLACILRMVCSPSMTLIFLNVAIRIRLNNDYPVDILDTYKKSHPNTDRRAMRRTYYAENIEHIREYNRQYQAMKATVSSINIFRKCP